MESDDSVDILKNIILTKEEEAVIELMKITVPLRDIRKKINLIGSYVMNRFLDEVSKRNNKPKENLKTRFWFELFNKEDLPKKEEASLIFYKGEKMFSEKIILKDNSNHDIKELTGIVASIGEAVGKVKNINGPKDFHLFNEGDVLVTFATRPEFLPVMKKSCAILTQEGGLTSHAAIVARELGKPCIVGIKNLVNSFNDGDLVEVDANEGKVIKIEKGD